MKNPQALPPLLGMNMAQGKIECVLFLEGRFRSLIVDNSPEGFNKLADWLIKLQVNRVHAFCDVGTENWQEAAAFLNHAGHRVTVLNEAQIRACAAVLSTPIEKSRMAA